MVMGVEYGSVRLGRGSDLKSNVIIIIIVSAIVNAIFSAFFPFIISKLGMFWYLIAVIVTIMGSFIVLRVISYQPLRKFKGWRRERGELNEHSKALLAIIKYIRDNETYFFGGHGVSYSLEGLAGKYIKDRLDEIRGVSELFQMVYRLFEHYLVKKVKVASSLEELRFKEAIFEYAVEKYGVCVRALEKGEAIKTDENYKKFRDVWNEFRKKLVRTSDFKRLEHKLPIL